MLLAFVMSKNVLYLHTIIETDIDSRYNNL